MIVEFLFQVNPITILLIVSGFLFFFYKTSQMRKIQIKEEEYEKIPLEYKVFNIPSNNENIVSCLSYNIMAYNFTKIEWFPYCEPELLHPKFRSPRIINEIKEIDSDVLFLQECDHDLFLEFYRHHLEKLGYSCHFKISNTNKIVTIVTCIKKSLFTVINMDYIDLNDDLSKLDDTFLRHKEALILHVRHNESGKEFILANTHLFWNPDYEYVKYGQLSKIIHYIEKKYGKDCYFILGGDFNSLPNSNTIKFMYKQEPELNTNVRGDFQKNKKFQEMFYNNHKFDMNLRSAYDCFKLNKDVCNRTNYADHHPDFTVFTHEFNGTLDYIFYNADKFKLHSLLKVPCGHDLKTTKLPNTKFPSDHLKIEAKFIIN